MQKKCSVETIYINEKKNIKNKIDISVDMWYTVKKLNRRV